MHMYVKFLLKVASRYAPSRVLSFDAVHVFKALQLMEKNGHASRAFFCKELSLGEGSIRTLVKHLKLNGLVETAKAGTTLSGKGRRICSEFLASMPAETEVPRCSVAMGKFNYAVLLKNFAFAVRSGIEQRDAAVKMGAVGATTLIFRENKFVMPGKRHDSLSREPHVRKSLVEKLRPEEEDLIIIGAADNPTTAELGTKNSALVTIINHEKHAW